MWLIQVSFVFMMSQRLLVSLPGWLKTSLLTVCGLNMPNCKIQTLSLSGDCKQRAKCTPIILVCFCVIALLGYDGKLVACPLCYTAALPRPSTADLGGAQTCNLYRLHTCDCEEGHGDEQVCGPVDGRHHGHGLPSDPSGEELTEDDVHHWKGRVRVRTKRIKGQCVT